MDKKPEYTVYDYDRLSEGYKLSLEHSVHVSDMADVSKLVQLPIDEVNEMKTSSEELEKRAFENVKTATKDWEKQAAVTQKLNRAIEYLKTPEIKHTSNKWVKEESFADVHTVSNKVYKMTYSLYVRRDYRDHRKERCDVGWSVDLNTPKRGFNIKLAGQEKSYPTRAEAEKYIQGRIKAYSHLFTEISPSIPKEYADNFKVSGVLLPGYSIEGEKRIEKPSIKKELAELKTAVTAKSPSKTKSKDAPER